MSGVVLFFSILQVSSNPIFPTIWEEDSTIMISIFPEDKAEVWSVKCQVVQSLYKAER